MSKPAVMMSSPSSSKITGATSGFPVGGHQLGRQRHDARHPEDGASRGLIITSPGVPAGTARRLILASPAHIDSAPSIGSAKVGYDGHRGWINDLACHPDHQRKGVGTALMTRARRLLLDRGCPKINLQVRLGNDFAIHFYESIGYTDDSVTSLGLRLSPDD